MHIEPFNQTISTNRFNIYSKIWNIIRLFENCIDIILYVIKFITYNVGPTYSE